MKEYQSIPEILTVVFDRIKGFAFCEWYHKLMCSNLIFHKVSPYLLRRVKCLKMTVKRKQNRIFSFKWFSVLFKYKVVLQKH